jgi:hypothetical protein
MLPRLVAIPIISGNDDDGFAKLNPSDVGVLVCISRRRSTGVCDRWAQNWMAESFLNSNDVMRDRDFRGKDSERLAFRQETLDMAFEREIAVRIPRQGDHVGFRHRR